MQVQVESIKVGNAQQVIADVCRSLDQGDAVLDLSQVKTVDSSVLAVVFAARRHAKNKAIVLQVLHPPAQMQALVAAYGVQSLF